MPVRPVEVVVLGGRLTTAPVVSVSPYACQNLHPNVSTLRASTSSLIGDAP